MSRLISLPTLLALAACAAPTADDDALVIVDESARDHGVFVEIAGDPIAEALPVWVSANDEALLVTPDDARELFLAPGEVLVVRGSAPDLQWFSADDLDTDAIGVVATEEAAMALAEMLGVVGFSELDGLRVIDAPGALFAASGLAVEDLWETVPITLAGEPIPAWFGETQLRCACELAMDLELEGTGTPSAVTVVHEIVLSLPDDELVGPFAGVPLETWATEGGTEVEVLTTGDGDGVRPNDRVTVDYAGMLTDGTVFDATDERGPATFPLWGLIDGWQEGLLGMQPGERRRLVIPPEQAYGDRGAGPIPPGSTLVFDVTLLEVEPGDLWLE